ncbi:MAG: hypothetical protein PHX15_01605 [Candidatus Nanoarchaeia archaeon]|jgi:hypothetical protein|nr:hypothetical protein [Candidatus Nanoarchaeia archaeon]MDD3993871.1 hypothetical protein [Candidatus Nanoarchaeia archaeon]MDD4563714.1 hypothetical protein [Candidatus Nanoarchaeia archaeon]
MVRKKEVKVNNKKQELELLCKNVCKENRVSRPFVIVLSIISILGFSSIVSDSFFNYSIEKYVESMWFIILSIGFIFESHPRRLFKRIKDTMNDRTFTAITTFILGSIAFIAGIFTLPFFNIINPAFLAVKGLLSLVAISFIIIQTWVIR